MNAINDFINNASLTKQSKWIVPALIALAVVIAFLGVTGCSPPHHNS